MLFKHPTFYGNSNDPTQPVTIVYLVLWSKTIFSSLSFFYSPDVQFLRMMRGSDGQIALFMSH